MAESSALQGMRVIDFGQYIAGPVTAMLLGDFGADVIRVDPPGGPRFKTAANATWNRGKRSIVLDLKNERDLAVARKLIQSADVLVENFRPGVMERLGLGAKAMCALNPRLIYCSIPGFASDDPRAGMRAWEGVLSAATACQSSHAALKNLSNPVYTAVPYSSMFGAALAAVSIAAALNARARNGQGQTIEVPLFNATFSALSGKLMKVHGTPEVDAASRWTHMLCKSGHWFMYLPARVNKLLLDLPEMAQWRDVKLTPEQLDTHLKALFLTRESWEWEDFCANAGFEGITSHTSAEWLHHPLAETTQLAADFDDPELGRFRGFNIAPRLSETPGKVRGPRARLDEHREEILKELEAPRAPVSAASSTTELLRSALQGVRVVDLGIILASPMCGRTLAEFGADIVKVDSIHRNPVNWHNDVNRAKRMILLDLKKPEGLELFRKLLKDADVLLENFRPGVADKLGIGYEDVSARRPEIVYCSVNAYGWPGKYSKRPGREVLAQAVTGMTLRLGGGQPVFNPLNANDYCTGLMCAFGILLSLLARRKTGRGQLVRSSLIYGATFLQTNVMQDYEGKHWNEANGQDCLGTGPLYRAYKTSDDWVFLAAKDCGLSACTELSALAGKQGAELERALEQRFTKHSAAEWLKILWGASIAAERCVLKLTSLTDDPRVRAQGLAVSREHAELGMVTTAGPGIKLSGTPVILGCPAPKPGADAAAILAEIGMDKELGRLIKDGVVVTEGVLPGGAS